MRYHHIEQKDEVLRGKPVINNTRIGVDLILEKIGNGETIEDLLLAHPTLTHPDILACISYGASLVRSKSVLLPKSCESGGTRDGTLN